MTDKFEPQSGLLSNALSASLPPKRAEGLWFTDREITLDGYEFVECRFDNCKLRVANAQYVNLQRCFISDDTNFIFGHSALSAIRLFNLKTNWYYYYINAPYWVPAKDEKGRITLTSNYFDSIASLFQQKDG